MTNLQNFDDLGQGNQNSNKKTMSSREIAELTGKRHSDVLESIRKMENAWVKVTQRKFSLSEYTDSTKELTDVLRSVMQSGLKPLWKSNRGGVNPGTFAQKCISRL